MFDLTKWWLIANGSFPTNLSCRTSARRIFATLSTHSTIVTPVCRALTSGKMRYFDLQHLRDLQLSKTHVTYGNQLIEARKRSRPHQSSRAFLFLAYAKTGDALNYEDIKSTFSVLLLTVLHLPHLSRTSSISGIHSVEDGRVLAYIQFRAHNISRFYEIDARQKYFSRLPPIQTQYSLFLIHAFLCTVFSTLNPTSCTRKAYGVLGQASYHQTTFTVI